jgi:hypothetical protein
VYFLDDAARQGEPPIVPSQAHVRIQGDRDGKFTVRRAASALTASMIAA